MVLLSLTAIPLPAEAQTTELVTRSFPSVADTFFVQTCCLNGTGTFQFVQLLRLPAEFQYGFYRFDLSTIFVGSSVLTANLTLFQAGYVDLGSSSLNVTAFGQAVGWDEERLSFDTWNQDTRAHPTVGSTETVSLATTSTFVTWTVTDLVDDWVNGILPNHGFRLEPLAGDSAFVNLRAREAVNVTTRPVLTVTYLQTVPEDPGTHPLSPFIAGLGVPEELFLAGLGIIALFLTYLGLFASHNPEAFGGRKSRPMRQQLRRFR